MSISVVQYRATIGVFYGGGSSNAVSIEAGRCHSSIVSEPKQ